MTGMEDDDKSHDLHGRSFCGSAAVMAFLLLPVNRRYPLADH